MKTKIWLIDDNEDIRNYFTENISLIDYIDLRVFDSLDAFIEAINGGGKPDMVFIDGQFDGATLSGTDIVKRVREKDGNGIMIYGLTNGERMEKEMEDAGANGYFHKDDLDLIKNFLSKK